MKREKRFLSLMMLAAMVLFAACEPEVTPDPPAPDPPVLTLAIELGEVGINTVTMTVTPSDNEAVYVYDVIQQSILNEHHEGKVSTYVANLVASVMEEYQTPEAVLERIGTKGESSYTYNTLSPDTEYVAFAVAVNTACEVVGEAVTDNFRTLPMPEVCSWEVTFDEVFYDGVSFTVTPSDNTVPYYFEIRPVASYGREVMSDEELLQTILDESSIMIDYYLCTDVYESVYQEFVLCSDTGYEVLVFAYSDGAPLTSIKRFPFRTLKSEIESLSFDISVTPETNSADVTIVPSDEYTMFMWDVVDKAELNGDYDGDIASYVEAYIADMVENYGLYELDFARDMGPTGADLVHVFEPSTDYVVWAAQVDEYGRVVGEITTKEFSTLEGEAGEISQMENLSLKPRARSERGSRR